MVSSRGLPSGECGRWAGMAPSPAGSWAIHYGKGELKYGNGGQLPEWARTIPGGLWARVDRED